MGFTVRKIMSILGSIPDKVYLACSGGMDSMVVFHFLSRAGRDVKCLYFNHGTKHGDMAQSFLEGFLGPQLVVGYIDGVVPKGRSKEDFWRERRYMFLDGFVDRKVITCHHLDDQIETFIHGLVHGVVGKTICYSRDNYLRPFLKVRKSIIEGYSQRHNIQFVHDPSNDDVRYTRNRIRHKIVPELLKVNPGLYKSLAKLL